MKQTYDNRNIIESVLQTNKSNKQSVSGVEAALAQAQVDVDAAEQTE